jgi:adenylyltransferase/sulfurtransferase
MQFETTHVITGSEGFLNRTPYEIGIPLFHIISARKGSTFKYYEFTRDSVEVWDKL